MSLSSVASRAVPRFRQNATAQGCAFLAAPWGFREPGLGGWLCQDGIDEVYQGLSPCAGTRVGLVSGVAQGVSGVFHGPLALLLL